MVRRVRSTKPRTRSRYRTDSQKPSARIKSTSQVRIHMAARVKNFGAGDRAVRIAVKGRASRAGLQIRGGLHAAASYAGVLRLRMRFPGIA